MQRVKRVTAGPRLRLVFGFQSGAWNAIGNNTAPADMSRAKQRSGCKKSRLQWHDDQLREWIGKEPDLTLEEIRARCAEELEVKIGINALWQRLNKLGLSFKKNAARKRAKPS